MKVRYEISDKMTIEIEGQTQKGIFEELGTLQEVFGEDTCGKCKSQSVRFQVRVVNDNTFYELKCNDCGAALSYGCHKKGDTLFPKRKDSEGNWLDNKGWVKWQPKDS